MLLILIISIIGFLNGCATQHIPMIYVSKQNIGIDIGTGEENPTRPELSLGYRSIDAAYVPTTIISQKGDIVSPVRGCYHAGHNVGIVKDCKSQVVRTGLFNLGNQDEKRLAMLHERMTGIKYRDSYNISSGHSFFKPLNNFDVTLTANSSGSGTSAKSKETDKSPTNPSQTNTSTLDPSTTGNNGNQHQSVTDSLSVFGSFGTSTDVEVGKIGVTLGKAFATGVAAQKLTEGASLEQSRNALAKVLENRTQCIKALTNAYGTGSIPKEAIEACR